jgi:hypothetical protein
VPAQQLLASQPYERKEKPMTTQHRRIKDSRSISLTMFAFVLLVLLPGSVAAQWTNGTDINNTNSGNVGIGTSTPAAKLHVAGGIYSSQAIDSAYTNGFRLVVTGPGDTRASWSYNGGVTTTRLTSVANVRTSFGSNGVDDQVFLDLSGNLGINTTTPGGKLHVNGAQFSPATSGSGSNSLFRLGAYPTTNLVLDGGVAADTLVYTWLQSRNQSNYALNYALALNPNGGNVGIGTNNPQNALHVNGSLIATGNTSMTNPTSVGPAFNAGYYAGGAYAFAQAYNFTTNVYVPLYTDGSKIVMNANSSGNVGIGTTNPTSKLHVAGDGLVTGNLSVSGNIAAKYQDVAEWVHASQKLVAGTVVVLDSTKSNFVTASKQAYDTHVAGVISAQPGVTLGEGGEGKVLVATTGRVKVKVSAANGPIRIGDLLVTGDTQGFAMKSVPLKVGGARLHRPGTLIGKALEPLASGQGEILVLLSLQ